MTIQRAFILARSGQYANVSLLKAALNKEGCRSVDLLLSPRAISSHLEAICAATFKARSEQEIVLSRVG